VETELSNMQAICEGGRLHRANYLEPASKLVYTMLDRGFQFLVSDAVDSGYG